MKYIRAVSIVLGLNLLVSLVHELLHWWIDFIVSGGRYITCEGGFLPWGWHTFGIHTCMSTQFWGWNQLIVVMLSLAAGLWLIRWSDVTWDPNVRWGVLIAGITIWIRYTLYLAPTGGRSGLNRFYTLNDGRAIQSVIGDVTWIFVIVIVVGGLWILRERLNRSPEACDCRQWTLRD